MRALTFVAVCLVAATFDRPLELLGNFRPDEIRECSGIVQSRRYPGVFWVHSDSGNAAQLYAVGRDGTVIGRFPTALTNVDWEDVATDDLGRLVIGEIGNNGLRLPVRAIYCVKEPDPNQPAGRPIVPDVSSFYRFPPGGRFDAESLFIDGGQAILISKRRDGGEAELYRVPIDPPAPLLRPALPVAVGRLEGFTDPVTGADLATDGKSLAVCAVDQARVYRRHQPGAAWKLVATVRFSAGQVEAICWDRADLILADEEGRLYRIAEAVWRSAGPDGAAQGLPMPSPADRPVQALSARRR